MILKLLDALKTGETKTFIISLFDLNFYNTFLYFISKYIDEILPCVELFKRFVSLEVGITNKTKYTENDGCLVVSFYMKSH